jgi:DNA helicase II / ATP-dependent DNA helicase PcrA
LTVPIDDVLNTELTIEQRAAATDAAAEILCLACAGSGKSRTLAYRIARLIAQGAAPKSIVAFTFTEKAAESIKLSIARALERAGFEPSILGAMYIGTIHSYCQYVLHEMDARYRQFEVLDENRFKLYLISRYPRLGLHLLKGSRGARYFEVIKEVAAAWSTLNDELLSPAAVRQQDPTLGQVLDNIRAAMNQDQFIDFSSMIRLVVEGLRNRDPGAERAVGRLAHLMVDEYQDVNPSQEQLIRELHGRSQTLVVTGDDDQAIYGWRGADVGNILTFQNRYPGCSMHTLSHNFRSTPAIVRSADAFAAAELGATRYVKNPQATPTTEPHHYGVHWFVDRQDEAEWVAGRIEALLGTRYVERDGAVRGLTPADFAILMRSTRSPEGTGQQPRHTPFTQALVAHNIPYSLEAGGSIFDRPQVAALRDTFELLRASSPDRNAAGAHFNTVVSPGFANADFNRFAAVMADWGRRIHAPVAVGTRRRVYPQQLVHDLLNAFGITRTAFDAGTMQDMGAFSRMLQDVEAVYMSIDSTERFQDILNFMQNIADTGYSTGTDDVLRRPDAVTVSTVHKVKGLEFPVVFVVDVEGQRFPGKRRNYAGWLPAAVLQSALQRNAYQGTREEEARLFYTALTRAERFLYVSGSENLPGGARQWKASPFAQRLNDPDITRDSTAGPAGIVAHPPVRRIDETVVPTSYSDIRYYLRCPRDYQLRKTFGFSPPIVDLFGFGMTVHAAVCKLHELYGNQAPVAAQAEAVAEDVFHLKHVPQARDPMNHPGPYERAKHSAVEIVRTYADSYADDFTRRRQIEVRFEVPVQHAVISGSIDLMLHEDANGNVLDATVIDFKAMKAGEDAEQNEDLQWTELALQVQLYAVAARQVLGQNARTGAVHLLKDNQRIEVPVSDPAVHSAVQNVEWAVDRIIAGDFPMRPHRTKCDACDFRALCPKRPESFSGGGEPPAIHVPGMPGTRMARAFSEYDDG